MRRGKAGSPLERGNRIDSDGWTGAVLEYVDQMGLGRDSGARVEYGEKQIKLRVFWVVVWQLI